MQAVLYIYGMEYLDDMSKQDQADVLQDLFYHHSALYREADGEIRDLHLESVDEVLDRYNALGGAALNGTQTTATS